MQVTAVRVAAQAAQGQGGASRPASMPLREHAFAAPGKVAEVVGKVRVLHALCTHTSAQHIKHARTRHGNMCRWPRWTHLDACGHAIVLRALHIGVHVKCPHGLYKVCVCVCVCVCVRGVCVCVSCVTWHHR